MNMAHGGADFREEFLTCSICLDEYIQPRQLPCLHVYCHECLEDIIKKSHPPSFRGKKKMACPMCKKEFYMPKDGVSGFPHDFRIQSMLDRQNPSMNSGSPSVPKRRNLIAEQKAIDIKFGEFCPVHNCKMELFCEEVKCRVPVCSTCYIEHHLGHKASLISNKVQDAKEYLQSELQNSQVLLEKLHEYSEILKKTVDQIDTAYEGVFQSINIKEKLLCDKVKEVCGSLRSEAGKEYSSEVKRFSQETNMLGEQIEKLKDGHTQCTDLLTTANEAELVAKSSDILNLFYGARDVLEHPVSSWRSPELLNLKDDITDEVIGDIMAPLVGSLCTIDQRVSIAKDKQPTDAQVASNSSKMVSEGWASSNNPTSVAGEDVSENESSSEGDFVKVKPGDEIDPAKSVAQKKELDPRAVKALMIAKWSVKSSVTGLGCTGDGNVVVCHYFDHSLSICDATDGTVKWRSRDKQLPGLIKALGVMMGTGQPCDALSVTIEGDEYMAVSYPHQSAIKLFKSVSDWPGEVSWEQDQIGFHNKQVKPAEMACSDKELMFLHWLMPLARSGEVHVLNMTTLPLQHVRTVETGFTVLTDICVLPMLRSDPLIICSVPKGLYAIDMSGNCYWRVSREDIPNMVTGGVCTDNRGHVYVADKENHVVHVLWHDGKILQSLFEGDNGIKYPCEVSYDKQRHNLVITNHSREEICVFSIQ